MNERDTPPLPPRGAILDPQRAARHLDLRIHPPRPELAPWIHHHWFIDWDVAEPFTQSVLGRPCGNLVVDEGKWMLSGPFLARFDRHLEGRGRVYGTQFRPGSLRAFDERPAKHFLDHREDIAPKWSIDAVNLEANLTKQPHDEARIDRITQLLLSRSPTRSEEMDEANRIVELVEERPDLTRTDALAREVGRSVRSLQRLLAAWVGMSPKQLVRRFRLQEASARLAEGKHVDLTDLAYALGYADQAHFSRDFKAVVGEAPSHYASRQGP